MLIDWFTRRICTNPPPPDSTSLSCWYRALTCAHVFTCMCVRVCAPEHQQYLCGEVYPYLPDSTSLSYALVTPTDQIDSTTILNQGSRDSLLSRLRNCLSEDQTVHPGQYAANPHRTQQSILSFPPTRLSFFVHIFPHGHVYTCLSLSLSLPELPIYAPVHPLLHGKLKVFS